MASQKKRRIGWRTYALLFCLTVFLVSGGLLVRDLVRSAGEQAANRDLAQQVRAAREASACGALTAEALGAHRAVGWEEVRARAAQAAATCAAADSPPAGR